MPSSPTTRPDTEAPAPHPAASPGQETAPDANPLSSAPPILTIVSWALLALVTAWILRQTIGHDFRQQPLVGDQASSYLQMLSLAHDGHDLSFNTLDYAHWEVIDWARQPYGLYFQAFSGGWAFAKPYGYSVLLTIPYRVFGPIVGVAFTNSALLLGMLALAVGLLRFWLRGPVVPLLAGAFVFASNAYMHAFPVVVDLFLAVGTGLCLYLLILGARRENLVLQVLGFGVFAFLFAEKTTLLVALAPMAGLYLWQARNWRHRAAMVGGFAVVFLVAIVPYLYYSDGASWNAYGGERYYGRQSVPFGPDPDAPLDRVATDETISISYIVESVTTKLDDAAQSALYYVAGRHTGLIVCFPIALLVIGLALWRARAMRPEAVAALVGIGLYAALYLVLFPDNYYGGGQAIGNRYFLQISPLVLVVAGASRIPNKALVGASLAAVALSLTLQWPHHETPQHALVDLERISPTQDLLPFETNQLGADYWRCGFAYCDPDD